jgi:hypothetical protein
MSSCSFSVLPLRNGCLLLFLPNDGEKPRLEKANAALALAVAVVIHSITDQDQQAYSGTIPLLLSSMVLVTLCLQLL